LAKALWRQPPHLGRLYHWDIKKLQACYPDYTKGTIKGKKSVWTTKINKGEVPMPPSPIEGEPIHKGKLTRSWEVAMRDTEGEWNVQTLHSYDHRPDPTNIAEEFEPAVQAKISPTKRKRAERLGKQILVFGDSQIAYHRLYDEDGVDYLLPTHSEETLSVITQINAHERPETVVNISDTVDLSEFGRFDPVSDSFHRTLSPAFQRAHDLYAQLRADNPDASLIEVDSNHTTRVQKNLMRKMPEMYGFTLPGEDYPLMSYYRLANLAGLEVNFISGYGGAEYVHGEEYGPGIIFKHGVTTSATPGAVARKEAAQNPNHHVVRGHGHSFEAVAQTTRDGDQLHYYQLGTSCDTKGAVPSYHSAMDDHGKPVKIQENWQNQLMMIEDFEDGHYNFNVIDVVKGIAYYRGRKYNGNE